LLAQRPAVRTGAFVLRFTPEAVAGIDRLPPVLRQPLTLRLEHVTVEHALRAIAAKAGLDLSYSRAVVPLGRRVSVAVDNGSVAEALRQVLHDARVELWISTTGKMAIVPVTSDHADGARETGTIVGAVTDAETGEPVQTVTIEVEGTNLRTLTSDSGWYRIANVPEGTYTLAARRFGYAKAMQPVSVTAESEITANFALQKAATALGQVVVTGTLVPTEVKALPSPVNVITTRDIEQQRPHTVGELFRQTVPGAVSFDIPNVPSNTAFSVRGTSTLTGGNVGQMKIFVDGVEAADLGGSAVDPGSIERIEIIRGPQAAAIYGSDAIGGVVQVFTKRGDVNGTGPRVDLEAAAGMIQTPYAGVRHVLRQNYRAAVSGGGTDVDYHFGASYSHTGSFIPDGEISAQSVPSVYGRVHVQRGRLTADISARHYVENLPFAFNPEMFDIGVPYYSKPFYTRQQIQNQTIGAHLTVAANSWWQHTLTLGWDGEVIDQAQVRPRLTDPSDSLLPVYNYHRSKESIRYVSTAQGRIASGLTGSLAVGFDHWRTPTTRLSSLGASVTGSLANTSGRRDITTNTGYFVQAQLGIHDALFLTGGLRAEQNTDFGDSLGLPISPRIGIAYVHPVGGMTVKLRSSWGRAIRPPSPGLKAGYQSSSGATLANPDLAPERQQGWDAGVDAIFGAHASLGVTYYDQTADDLIQQVTLQLVPLPTGQYQNIGRVRNRGVELEGTAEIGSLMLKAQYAYTSSRVKRLAPGYAGVLRVGDNTWLTPKHTGGLSATFSPTRATTLAAGVTYVGGWTYYDTIAYLRCLGGTGPCQNTTYSLDRGYFITYPGFVKANTTLTQQFTPTVAGFVSIDNLTNNQSSEFYNLSPVMGRVSTIGVKLHF
jgi:iron complex outermembrane receptor protein